MECQTAEPTSGEPKVVSRPLSESVPSRSEPRAFCLSGMLDGHFTRQCPMSNDDHTLLVDNGNARDKGF